MRSHVLAVIVMCANVACAVPPPTKDIVVLVDATASIPMETRRKMTGVIADAAQQLRRGDRLVVIPITGHARAHTPEHILRFQVDARREPYDADRRRLMGAVSDGLANLADTLASAPFRDTDLLGAFQFAVEEFSETAGVDKRIVCLSDFIQDDQQFNFRRDAIVANASAAEAAANKMAAQLGARLADVSVYFGEVQSTESSALRDSRQAAIRTFWTVFVERQGALAYWKGDGLGHVMWFLQRPTSQATISE